MYLLSLNSEVFQVQPAPTKGRFQENAMGPMWYTQYATALVIQE